MLVMVVVSILGCTSQNSSTEAKPTIPLVLPDCNTPFIEPWIQRSELPGSVETPEGMFITIIYPSMQSLIESASLIVYGRVIEQSEPFEVVNIEWEYYIDGTRVFRGMRFIDSYVEVYEVLRGETSATEIAVRAMANVSPAASLTIGEEYLLLLHIPGSYYATPGYYYTVGGGSVFPKVEGERFVQFDRFHYQSHNPYRKSVYLSELRTNLIEVNATIPVMTEEDHRRVMIKEYKERMEAYDIWPYSPFRGLTSEELLDTLINAPLRPSRIIVD